MQQTALSTLDRNRIMAVATVRPDGWPQATMVGYIHEEFTLYFLISRGSQKFRNMVADDRISIAIGSDAADPRSIEGLSMAAHVEEVRDEPWRSRYCTLLAQRHPGYFRADTLDFAASALMRARPELISIVDFSQGLGHTDQITVGAEQIVDMEPNRPNDWGPQPRSSSPAKLSWCSSSDQRS